MIEIKEDFKLRLDKALSFAGMKPIDLANKTHISESTISQYRSGYSKPKDKRLVQIANCLGVNPSWLMGLDVPMIMEESSTPTATSEDNMARALDFYERYEKASPEIKTAIEALLKATKEK